MVDKQILIQIIVDLGKSNFCPTNFSPFSVALLPYVSEILKLWSNEGLEQKMTVKHETPII